MRKLSPPEGPAPGLADFGWGAAAAALAVAAATSALLASPGFFLTDDYATQFMPAFREIARLIESGKWPILTDRLWNGGAFLQEYQYAVFNPISVALYLALGGMTDLGQAAAVFSLAHIALLAGGAFFLARTLGCARREALLAGLFAPLSDWIFYWGAADWIPALVSLAWLVWAWGFLVLTFRRPKFAPAAAATVALTLLSGWPFADLALALSVAAAAVAWAGGLPESGIRGPAWVGLALLVGGLLAAPALVPLAQYAGHTDRGSDPGLWTTEPVALLGFGVPRFATHWRNGLLFWQTIDKPMVYVAWFAPLALVNADWRCLWRRPEVRLMTAVIVALAGMSMFRSIWQFRWMSRLLPYCQLAILLLACRAVSDSERAGRAWRLTLSALTVFAEVWLTLCQNPSQGKLVLGVSMFLGVATLAAGRFSGRSDTRFTLALAAAGMFAFQLTLWTTVADGYPTYPNNWRPPRAAPAAGQIPTAGPTLLAIFPPFGSDPGPAFWRDFAPDNTILEQPRRGIVGYSSMISRPFLRRVCESHVEMLCHNVVERITTPIAPSDRGLIDLMGVDQVVIELPTDAAAFRKWAGAGWRESREAAGGWRFDRIAPSGPVTWTSPGLSAKAIAAGPARVTLSVANASATPATVAVARAWYPDWRASLNGAPVAVRPLEGLVLAAVLPSRARGRLELTFWPAGLTLGLWLAALGAALMLLAVLFPAIIDAPAERLSGIIGGRDR